VECERVDQSEVIVRNKDEVISRRESLTFFSMEQICKSCQVVSSVHLQRSFANVVKDIHSELLVGLCEKGPITGGGSRTSDLVL